MRAVFVVLACRIFGKPALQATLRIFGLCGSCVVLVSVVLWFLDRLWFLRIGGLAIDADGCASDRAHVVFVARWSCPN